MNQRTGTSNIVSEITLDPHWSPGVLQEPNRLRYWRQSTPNTLDADNLATLRAEQAEMATDICMQSVQEEMWDLQAEAGWLIQQAVRTDDWSALESKSRNFDYQALVALARAKMLNELANRLEAEGKIKRADSGMYSRSGE